MKARIVSGSYFLRGILLANWPLCGSGTMGYCIEDANNAISSREHLRSLFGFGWNKILLMRRRAARQLSGTDVGFAPLEVGANRNWEELIYNKKKKCSDCNYRF